MLIEDSLKNTAVSLADLCDAVKDKLSEEVTNLAERSKELENERAKFEAEKRALTRAGITEGDVLTINAGGQIFIVKRSTLLMAPEEGLLHAMFSGRWDDSIARDSENRIILDMSPQVFSTILSHLRVLRLEDRTSAARRQEKLPIDKVYEKELETVCNYYGVFNQPIFSNVDLQVRSIHEGVGIDAEGNGKTVRLTGNTMGPHCILGVNELMDQAVWKVTLVSSSTDWMFAGIIATDDAPTSSRSHLDPTAFGWAGQSKVYLAGSRKPWFGGWTGWKSGCYSIFKLDAVAMTLKMYNSCWNQTYLLKLDGKKKWRLHLNILNDSVVELSKATYQEEDFVDG